MGDIRSNGKNIVGNEKNCRTEILLGSFFSDIILTFVVVRTHIWRNVWSCRLQFSRDLFLPDVIRGDVIFWRYLFEEININCHEHNKGFIDSFCMWPVFTCWTKHSMFEVSKTCSQNIDIHHCILMWCIANGVYYHVVWRSIRYSHRPVKLSKFFSIEDISIIAHFMYF